MIHHFFQPEVEGIYSLNILTHGQHIKGSPFIVMIDSVESKNLPFLQTAYLDGIHPSTSLAKGRPVHFTVNTRKNEGGYMFFFNLILLNGYIIYVSTFFLGLLILL